jgi:hypothetical protein
MTTPLGRLPVVLGLVGFALANASCGGSSSSSAGPRNVPSSAATLNRAPQVTPIEQLVRIRNVGIGFGLPKRWLSLDGPDIHAADDPELKKVAKQLGFSSSESLLSHLSPSVQTLSVTNEPATYGIPDTVTCSTGSKGTMDDAAIKQQLSKLKARYTPLRHFQVAVGDATSVRYGWTSGVTLLYGDLLAVTAGDTAFTCTVVSDSSDRAYSIELEIDRTLQRLPD